MSPTDELITAQTPAQEPVLDVGDVVFVAYWRSFALPGLETNGSWEFATARVVSAGLTAACVEVDNPSAMSDSGASGSCLRFAPIARVFTDRIEVETACRIASGKDRFPDRETVRLEMEKSRTPNPVG